MLIENLGPIRTCFFIPLFRFLLVECGDTIFRSLGGGEIDVLFSRQPCTDGLEGSGEVSVNIGHGSCELGKLNS